MLAHPSFTANTRRKAFLRYLVEETLEGREDRLKGFAVAVAVFGRDASFDPQTDPIVRLEARRLRFDLDAYSVGAGNQDPVRIWIPKGAYIPIFDHWQSGDSSNRPAPLLEIESPIEAEGAGPNPVSPSEPAPRPFGVNPLGNVLSAVWRSTRDSRRLQLAIATFVVAVGALLLWKNDWLLTSDEIESAVVGPAVIVLPFESLSASEEDRFLAAGMTQELITDLMRFSGFRLFSMSVSFDQVATADPIELGHSLGAQYVVSGSIRSEDAAVRIAGQLVDAQTGQVLWSGTYDRDRTPGNLLDLQSDLAAGIATTLGQSYGILNNDASGRLASTAPSRMSSYDCVLRAYTYRRTFSTELYAPTLACLEVAVRRDPDYANAWAMLGWLHLDGARFGPSSDGYAERSFEQALDTASRALVLDPSNVLALQALSATNHYMGRYDESIRIQRQALALNPNEPDTLAQLGWRLAIRGKWDEGIPYLEQAIARSVSPPGAYFHLLAIHQYLQGDYSAALALAQRALVDDSSVSWALIAILEAEIGSQETADLALARMAERWPLMASDPAAAFRVHHATDEIVNAMVAGLRKAGWTEPSVSPSP